MLHGPWVRPMLRWLMGYGDVQLFELFGTKRSEQIKQNSWQGRALNQPSGLVAWTWLDTCFKHPGDLGYFGTWQGRLRGFYWWLRHRHQVGKKNMVTIFHNLKVSPFVSASKSEQNIWKRLKMRYIGFWDHVKSSKSNDLNPPPYNRKVFRRGVRPHLHFIGFHRICSPQHDLSIFRHVHCFVQKAVLNSHKRKYSFVIFTTCMIICILLSHDKDSY